VALQKEMSGMVSRLRDAAALAEDKESEVERLKREKMGIIWLLIYMRSYLVKFADLKQSLEIAEKEREIDLKEREAIVYRADSLQREFDHINKLLQVFRGDINRLVDSFDAVFIPSTYICDSVQRLLRMKF